MPINSNSHSIRKFDQTSTMGVGDPSMSFVFFSADILGHERIDLTRLKKQAHISQTQIPKIPRITRTIKTLDSVLKILDEHGRLSKAHIDDLTQSVEKENHQLTRVRSSSRVLKIRRAFVRFPSSSQQLHESQVAYLKLQAHTASLQSLKECYCRYAHMLDGARTMFQAYQQSGHRRDPIDQVKLGLRECTQVSSCTRSKMGIVITCRP